MSYVIGEARIRTCVCAGVREDGVLCDSYLRSAPASAFCLTPRRARVASACKYILAYRPRHPYYGPPMESRERILAAAARVYAEHGFRGATTRRIAEEAGVNEITIFRQFGSKAALID